jgi:hypothetical protein
VLNTLQYLIVDEILLARVMEQKSQSVYTHGQYTDEESTGVENGGDFDDEETEYATRKGRPAIL